ncbi:MAG: hypothetical protein ACRD5M_02785 [Candidatus Acidiferrales bacterium]
MKTFLLKCTNPECMNQIEVPPLDTQSFRIITCDKCDATFAFLNSELGAAETPATKLGVVLGNDGEVAVFVPLSCKRDSLITLKPFRFTCTQRREGVSSETFLTQYPMGDSGVEMKAQVLDKLGITHEEMNEAMQTARGDSAECHSLFGLVKVSRRRKPRGR